MLETGLVPERLDTNVGVVPVTVVTEELKKRTCPVHNISCAFSPDLVPLKIYNLLGLVSSV